MWLEQVLSAPEWSGLGPVLTPGLLYTLPRHWEPQMPHVTPQGHEYCQRREAFKEGDIG